MSGDRRLMEDVLPVAAVSRASANEKVGGRQGHPSTLHLWWARRPLAAARAAVYAALVPAGGRTRTPEEEADWFDALCRWGGPQGAIETARREVLAANDGVPPRVLDMFAGGGAIPLEAARLGCEAIAVELNPVAHLVERCMLEFPQQFPGLADDVRTWGKVWIDRAWGELADLYPQLGQQEDQQQLGLGQSTVERRPLAYLWTRTVRCPNPKLSEHLVPLVRQTWLARGEGRFVALRAVVHREALAVEYEIVEGATVEGLGFDPGSGSKRGEATCQICGATVGSEYIKLEGKAHRMGIAPLAAVVLHPSGRGRAYLSARAYPLPDDEDCKERLATLEVDPPDEPLPERLTGGMCTIYGLTRFEDLFTPRQLLTLCTLASRVRDTHHRMLEAGLEPARAAAVATAFGLVVDRVADRCSTLCRWDPRPRGGVMNTFARQALPMVWDFVETNPFGGAGGDVHENLDRVAEVIERSVVPGRTTCIRGSATALPLEDDSQDAVITDPPYYDNISYADLSDFFYVWLKRSIGFLYPDDLGGELAPKKNEAVVAPYRHHGRKDEARTFYEGMMAKAFEEANRVLKPGAPLVCIYAHKTTLGWSSLVDALRTAGFTITEAWPLDTEMPERSVGQNTASLASSIFLVARKRDIEMGTGSEAAVMSELDTIIAERLDRLQKAGVTGSDLIIASVGAGLRAFTKYVTVEQDNGESLPAERFLAIVQNRVLDAVFGGLSGADAATRFYVAAQFSYGYAWVPFAEANNLAYMTGVELDGPHGLTSGRTPLVSKQKSNVAIRDFDARGEDRRLGLPDEDTGARPPVIDVAHGILWRAEYRPSELKEYMAQARPDGDLLRTVVQALAGKALRNPADGKAPEAAAAERLLAAWRRLVEDYLSPQARMT